MVGTALDEFTTVKERCLRRMLVIAALITFQKLLPWRVIATGATALAGAPVERLAEPVQEGGLPQSHGHTIGGAIAEPSTVVVVDPSSFSRSRAS
jgi:hypothetical protein